MKPATIVLLALVALVAVNGSKILHDGVDNATTLDPALKGVFGTKVYESLLELPQETATALAGSVVNGTQQVWAAPLIDARAQCTNNTAQVAGGVCAGRSCDDSGCVDGMVCRKKMPFYIWMCVCKLPK